MSKTLRRWLGAVAAAAVALTVLSVAAPVAGADTGDFYTPPSPLPAGSPGEIIRTLPSTYPGQSGVTSTRIMYLSQDAHDSPVAVTGDVLAPSTPWSGPGPRPLVAYAPFTFGTGPQCVPSRTLSGDFLSGDLLSVVQNAFVDALLQKGFAVAETDYPRSAATNDLMYMMRRPQAYAVLNVARAAESLPGSGLSAASPVGIEGYSEGGAGAASAAELAPTYAPELKVVGTYAGAVPADLKGMAQNLEGSLYFAFEAMAIVGANAAYPEENITSFLNSTGQQAYQQLQQACTLSGLLGFAFQKSNSYTTTGKSLVDYLDMPQYAQLVADQVIGNLKPSAPVEIESAPNDDVVPNSQNVALAKEWCAKGVTVQYNDIPILSPGFTHALGAFTATGDGANWLADRFAGKPATGNCGQS